MLRWIPDLVLVGHIATINLFVERTEVSFFTVARVMTRDDVVYLGVAQSPRVDYFTAWGVADMVLGLREYGIKKEGG